MPLSKLLKSAAGACRYCGQKAGVLSRSHSGCRRTFDAGFQEMVKLAAEAARTHSFDEKTLRLSLAEIASRSHGDGAAVNQALEEGWKQGIAHSMADGILTSRRRPNSASSATGWPSQTLPPTRSRNPTPTRLR